MLLSSGDNILLWEAEMFGGPESRGPEALTMNMNLGNMGLQGFWAESHSTCVCEKHNWTKTEFMLENSSDLEYSSVLIHRALSDYKHTKEKERHLLADTG